MELNIEIKRLEQNKNKLLGGDKIMIETTLRAKPLT
jgi:hypothetical protein